MTAPPDAVGRGGRPAPRALSSWQRRDPRARFEETTMTNTASLSATQRTILTTACERRGGRVQPLTAGLKGGAVQIVLKSLLAKRLIAEVPAKGNDLVWRTSDESVSLSLT